MKPFSAISLLLLILMAKEARSSIREEKLKEFQERLQEFTKQPLAASSPASENKRNDGKRVYYPKEYGADPTGEEESSEAILSAVRDAFQVQNGVEMLPGLNDLGGIIIDFQGGNYKISTPITFPSSGGANLVVKGGTLRASDTFPGDRHLIELCTQCSSQSHTKSPSSLISFNISKAQNAGIRYEDITFRDILFDSSYRGGGILISDSARTRINNCFFLHFTTEGISVQNGHETFISSSFLGQHSTVGSDPGEKYYSGTAIDLASNDNAITDVAIFSAGIGIVLRGQANIVTGVHCYNKATYFGGIGILVKLAGTSLTRIDNCYLDFTAIVMEDPVQVHVTNGLFLGDANIVLKSIKGKISGLNIVDNMFNGNPKNMVPIVTLDGQFSSVDQVVIDRNNVNGMSFKSTVGRLTVAGNGTKWAADFSPVLVFPNRINHFQYSFYVQESRLGFPVLAVTNLTNNVVVVESDRTVIGVVSIIVDQYNMVGESSLPI